MNTTLNMSFLAWKQEEVERQALIDAAIADTIRRAKLARIVKRKRKDEASFAKSFTDVVRL